MPAWAVGAWAEGAWEGTAWAQVSIAQPDQVSGGWEQVTYKRRKTDEEIRQERIKLGILPPVELKPTLVILPKPVQPELELTQAEINAIKARVQNEIDLEIALYLKAIEKRRQQMIDLILILDAA